MNAFGALPHSRVGAWIFLLRDETCYILFCSEQITSRGNTAAVLLLTQGRESAALAGCSSISYYLLEAFEGRLGTSRCSSELF